MELRLTVPNGHLPGPVADVPLGAPGPDIFMGRDALDARVADRIGLTTPLRASRLGISHPASSSPPILG